MIAITIQRETIQAFKRQWPCNGIPANADIINCVFDKDGSLVDLELIDAGDNVIPGELYQDAGASLSALMDDAKKSYTTTKHYDGSLGVAEINHY